MSFKDTVVIIQNTLISGLASGGYSTVHICFENIEEPSNQLAPWVRIVVLNEVGDSIEVGDTVNSSTSRYEGTIIVQIFGRSGQGLVPVQSIADVVATIFGEKSLSYGSSGLIRTRRANHRPVGNDDRGWYQHQVHVRYYRDINES